MAEKNCKLIFTNKQTYDFSFEDIDKAIKWSSEKGNVWAIKTPYGILQPMDEEMFDNVSTAMFENHTTTPDNMMEDLV